VDLRDPPKDKDGQDVAREIGRALASLTPVVGGPVQVLFENVIGPSLEKRRQQWFEEVAEVVRDLQHDVAGLTPQELSKNDIFITTILQATQIAMRNHQNEKREALKNAIFNSAIPGTPSDDEQLLFLRLIDTLTPRQILLVAFLHRPRDWLDDHNIQPPSLLTGAVAQVIERCMPEMRGNRDHLQQLIRELQAAGLIRTGDFIFTTQSGEALYRRETTKRGEDFLQYITRPSLAKAQQ
jgi:hypothetical protein